MTTPVGDIAIANQALGLIGTRSIVASFDEGSAESIQISIFYEPTRDEILRSHRWNFATQQITLTLLKDATVHPGTVAAPWNYAYAYPSDCLFFHTVLPPYVTSPNLPIPTWMSPHQKFQVAGDKDANNNDIIVILSNQSAAIGAYTKRVTNPQLFDPMFADALAHALAGKLAMALKGDKAQAEGMFKMASVTIKDAMARDATEGLRVQEFTPDWLAVRGYASDYVGPWPYGYWGSWPGWFVN